MVEVEGYVWCSKEGEVHSDTLNPHGYNTADPLTAENLCKPEDHHALFMDSDRSPKGEYSGFEAEQILRRTDPARSKPVSLNVRRHTPETQAIFLGNLINALPADMLYEDRERIAKILLDTATEHGTLLRRKRIIDNLHRTLSQMRDHNPDMNPPFSYWQDAIEDALVEIQDLL